MITTNATFADCVTSAKDYIARNPQSHETYEARVFFHSMMKYFDHLGCSRGEQSEILKMWVESVVTVERVAWHRGYKAGFESGKNENRPPF